MRETTYDVVLYGASGFVGKQTVRYFAERVRPGEVRWAIAGRDRQKLQSVRSEVGIDVDILVADSQDRTGIDSLVSQTRVLLNTAGPFVLYGDAIVDACVRYHTHYVDITGETPWVKGLIERSLNESMVLLNEITHIWHQYRSTDFHNSQNMRKRAWKNIDVNTILLMRPMNTLHVDAS